MLKQWLSAGFLACALVTSGSVGASHAQTVQPKATSLDTVKSAVLDVTGYDSGTVELTATKVQFVVTVVNSKLIDRPGIEREGEAARIASAIAHVIADKPEFKGIQAMHVDYVKRQAGSTHTDTIDGIDFRKDPQGNFQHHVT